MAFIGLPLGFRVAVEYTLHGELVVNVYHVTRDVPVNSTNLTALAQIFIDWWDNDAKILHPNDMRLVRVVATDVREPGGLTAEIVPSGGIPGTASGASLPGNVAVCISLRSNFAARSGRGRKYMAGIGEAVVTGNTISPASAANYAQEFLDLYDRVTNWGGEIVIASYQFQGAPREVAQAYSIASVQVDQLVDSQRRRLAGRGI